MECVHLYSSPHVSFTVRLVSLRWDPHTWGNGFRRSVGMVVGRSVRRIFPKYHENDGATIISLLGICQSVYSVVATDSVVCRKKGCLCWHRGVQFTQHNACVRALYVFSLYVWVFTHTRIFERIFEIRLLISKHLKMYKVQCLCQQNHALKNACYGSSL